MFHYEKRCGIGAAIYSWEGLRLTAIIFVELNREFVTGEANSFGNDIRGAELRLRNTCEYQPDNRINPLAMQLHNGLLSLAYGW